MSGRIEDLQPISQTIFGRNELKERQLTFATCVSFSFFRIIAANWKQVHASITGLKHTFFALFSFGVWRTLGTVLFFLLVIFFSPLFWRSVADSGWNANFRPRGSKKGKMTSYVFARIKRTAKGALIMFCFGYYQSWHDRCCDLNEEIRYVSIKQLTYEYGILKYA